MDHWHAYAYTGRAYTDSAVRKGEAPSNYAPFMIKDWLRRPAQQIIESFTEPDVAAKWLRGEMEKAPPLQVASFSIDERVAYAEQTLRQTAGADVVWGYYSSTGQYVSRAVIRCLQGKGQLGVDPVPCPAPLRIGSGVAGV
ncbi:hypothetical protein ACFPN0_15405 [Kitasatospora cinereorecta]